MTSQFENALRDRKEKKSAVDWAMYMTTWESQKAHEIFLYHLLEDARQFALSEFGQPSKATVLRRRLRLLMRLHKKCRALMADPEEDNYVVALREIASYRLFHDTSVDVGVPELGVSQ